MEELWRVYMDDDSFWRQEDQGATLKAEQSGIMKLVNARFSTDDDMKKALRQIVLDVKRELYFKDGNHRAAWFMMNYVLIKNGYEPVYFKNEKEWNSFKNMRELDGAQLDQFIGSLKLTKSMPSAASPLREEDIRRLTPRVSEEIYIEAVVAGQKRNITHEILEVDSDSTERAVFHLKLLNLATNEETGYKYNIQEELQKIKIIEKDLAGFDGIRVLVAGTSWKQYTNRLYKVLIDRGHPDVAEDEKWRLYLHPAGKNNFVRLIDLVKEVANDFDGPLEFKYLSEEDPQFEKILTDPQASKFVINFASEADARAFHAMLRAHTDYAEVQSAGQTPAAEELDPLSYIAQGHTAVRLETVKDNSSSTSQKTASSPVAAEETNPGGIDLNPKNLQLNVHGDPVKMNLPDPQTLDPASIDGFIPVIINVAPVTDIHLLLGDAAGADEKDLTLSRR